MSFKFISFCVCIISLCCLNLNAQSFNDVDGDGMSDEWETDHGLDPNNPRDAWFDPDGDMVLNLFEFILKAAPNDSSVPPVIEVEQGDDLETFITGAPLGAILRIQEGDFPIYMSQQARSGAFRLMLQGGWNSDFTVHDPCAYPTYLSAENKLDLISFNYDTLFVDFIMDGVDLIQEDGVSGGISVYLNEAEGNFAYHNCRVVNSAFSGLGGAFGFSIAENSKANCWLTNNLIANNKAQALRMSVRDTSEMNIKIYHNTFYNNADTSSVINGDGIDASVSDNSVLDLQVRNSIFYKNDPYDIEIFTYGEGLLTGKIDNSIYRLTDLPGISDFEIGDHLIFSNPKFTAPTANDFSLSADSPAIGLGQNLGLVASISGKPNPGYINCLEISTSVNERKIIDRNIKIFPNPSSRYINLDLTNYDDMKELDIAILNSNGGVIRKENYRSISSIDESLQIDLPALAPGLYYLLFQSNGNSDIQKLIIE